MTPEYAHDLLCEDLNCEDVVRAGCKLYVYMVKIRDAEQERCATIAQNIANVLTQTPADLPLLMSLGGVVANEIRKARE